MGSMAGYDATLDPISPFFDPASWGPQEVLPVLVEPMSTEPILVEPIPVDPIVALIEHHAAPAYLDGLQRCRLVLRMTALKKAVEEPMPVKVGPNPFTSMSAGL